MPVIYKYPLSITGEQLIRMPVQAKPLTVQLQNDQPCLWAQVDPSAIERDYVVKMFGTGHELINPGEYVATFQDGPYVLHVFIGQ